MILPVYFALLNNLNTIIKISNVQILQVLIHTNSSRTEKLQASTECSVGLHMCIYNLFKKTNNFLIRNVIVWQTIIQDHYVEI